MAAVSAAAIGGAVGGAIGSSSAASSEIIVTGDLACGVLVAWVIILIGVAVILGVALNESKEGRL